MSLRILGLTLFALLLSPTLGASISARELADGKAFGFELKYETLPNGTQTHKWVPSKEMLDEQRARIESYYIIDPITNKSIRNPETNPEIPSDGKLSKRNRFNPYNGAECRMVFKHNYNSIAGVEEEEFRILDHRNTKTNFAVFDLSPGNWEYYQLDGHRGWWGIARYANTLYGIDAAFGHIEGQKPDRNMKWDDYCWYAEGFAGWGYYGEASCTSWCSAFNW